MYVNSLFNMGGLNVTFGKRLRYLREENDLSQIELAKTLNITSQALSQYELNKRMPDTEMVRRIAKYFNVSVDFLLGESDERSPADKIKAAVQGDPELQRLWKRMQERDDLKLAFKQLTELSPRDIREILRVIDRIQKEEYKEEY